MAQTEKHPQGMACTSETSGSRADWGAEVLGESAQPCEEPQGPKASDYGNGKALLWSRHGVYHGSMCKHTNYSFLLPDDCNRRLLPYTDLFCRRVSCLTQARVTREGVSTEKMPP